jgi:hypothetical protein
MTEYLYLLPFADGKHFKIGLSSNGDKRILKMDRAYKVLLDQALIVTSSKPRILKVIENELKISFEQCDHPYGTTEGHTEIRGIEHFEAAIDLIKQKHASLEIRISKYEDLVKQQPQEFENWNTRIRAKIDVEEIRFAKSNFLKLLRNNINTFKRYDFAADTLLVLTFNANFTCQDIINLGHIGCIDIVKVVVGYELYFHFGDGRPLSDGSNRFFIDDVCEILNISPKYGTLNGFQNKYEEIKEMEENIDLQSASKTSSKYSGSVGAMVVLGERVKIIEEVLAKMLDYVNKLSEIQRLG